MCEIKRESRDEMQGLIAYIQSWKHGSKVPLHLIALSAANTRMIAVIVVYSVVVSVCTALGHDGDGIATYFNTNGHHNLNAHSDAHYALRPDDDHGRHKGRDERHLPAQPKRAYVTLLYSDFLHGTRALGQSLRETGTKADTVVLVTPDVNTRARDILSRDGWM